MVTQTFNRSTYMIGLTMCKEVSDKRAPDLGIFKLMSNAPHVLTAFLDFKGALEAKSGFTAKEREQIALAVAGYDECLYCASAHTAIGLKLGLSQKEAGANLAGVSEDLTAQIILDGAIEMMANEGNLSAATMTGLKTVLSESQITELVALVALNIFTNYFNHVASTPCTDFPVVEFD